MSPLPLLLLAAPWLVWLGAAGLIDRVGTRARPRGHYHAIIVAGCAVGPDGRASRALRRRTTLAVRHWKAGRAPRIVLTGGVGRHPPSEARAAAVVCRELGVPEEALVLEEHSTTTEENARFATALVGRGRVLVVSDSYHALRCRLLFGRQFGEADAVGATPPCGQRLRMSFREVPALLRLLLRPPS